jgi:hypothetical protein
MSEHSFWTLVRKNLALKMHRVENRVAKGTPDVHYLRDGKSGWIELKYIADWPKKRIASGLMLNQAMWLQEYVEHKGSCWVLIRIGRDFIGLVDGKDARVLYDRPSTKGLLQPLGLEEARQHEDRGLGGAGRCYCGLPPVASINFLAASGLTVLARFLMISFSPAAWLAPYAADPAPPNSILFAMLMILVSKTPMTSGSANALRIRSASSVTRILAT